MTELTEYSQSFVSNIAPRFGVRNHKVLPDKPQHAFTLTTPPNRAWVLGTAAHPRYPKVNSCAALAGLSLAYSSAKLRRRLWFLRTRSRNNEPDPDQSTSRLEPRAGDLSINGYTHPTSSLKVQREVCLRVSLCPIIATLPPLPPLQLLVGAVPTRGALRMSTVPNPCRLASWIIHHGAPLSMSSVYCLSRKFLYSVITRSGSSVDKD
ncbi:hypothetical protein BC835DRAFT_968628 [Cytidiella melzeri]|nr:hypothetical protein BC835DRAFT_968628 [Cytidiella melzeri]